MKWFLVAFFSLGMVSCAAMQESFKDRCWNMDWVNLGRKDALAGKKPSSEAVQQCSAVNAAVPKDSDFYKKGFVEGLKQFCTYDYGVSFGREGGTYQRTCPPEFEKQFLSGFSKGKVEHDKLQASRKQSSSSSFLSPDALQKTCRFDSDCKIKVECKSTSEPQSVSRCEDTGETCNFDSDCTRSGDCTSSVCK